MTLIALAALWVLASIPAAALFSLIATSFKRWARTTPDNTRPDHVPAEWAA